MGVKERDLKLNYGEEEEETGRNALPKTRGQAKEHIDQLQRLQEKDPEFFEFLKEHDKELLEFNDEDIDEDADDAVEDAELHESYKNYEPEVFEKEEKPSKKVITSEMVDSWCHPIEENGKLDEKKSAASPLSQYVSTLRQRAQQRTDSLSESSVLVGEHSSVFGKSGSDIEDEDTGGRGFLYLAPPGCQEKHPEEKKSKKKKRKMEQQDKAAPRDEDVVEDLVLSSDEDDEPLTDNSAESDGNEDIKPVRRYIQKLKAPPRGSKKKIRPPANKAKKRKTSR